MKWIVRSKMNMKDFKVTGVNKKKQKIIEKFLDEIEAEKWMKKAIIEATFIYDIPIEKTPTFKEFKKLLKVRGKPKE